MAATGACRPPPVPTRSNNSPLPFSPSHAILSIHLNPCRSNFHHDNLDLFWSAGFGICGTLPGYADGYYKNSLYLAKDGSYGGGQTCGDPAGTAVYGNTIWSPTGAITECGKTLAEYQATGGDPGTTASAYPDDSVVLAAAKALLSIN